VVIFGSLLLIFAAIGLAVLGVVDASNALLIGSIAASLLAAVGLVVGARQAAADAIGDVPRVPAEPAPAQRLAPVGGGAPAATGTVYPSGSAATATRSTATETAAGATGVIPSGTVPTPGEPVDIPVSPAPAVADQAPVGTIPVQADAGAFPSSAAPVDDVDQSGSVDDVDQSGSVDDVDQYASVDQYGSVRGRGEVAEESLPAGDPIAVAADAIGPDATGADDLGLNGFDHGAVGSNGGSSDDPPGEPAIEPATRADRERVAQLDSEVVVIDGHPRYHLDGCLHLLAREGLESLPVAEAEELGFTPCSACAPVRTLLAD